MPVESPRATVRETLSRVVYTVLWYLATPVIAGYLLWRARKQPAYRRHWIARFFGSDGPRPVRPCLWVHAVSVGETRAAAPLVEALIAGHPDHEVVVTNMTPTGRETAIALFGDRVRHAYLAYDYPHAVAVFLAHWRPRLGIVMETEIWPNLLAAAARRGVPMMLANARLSPKSLVGARRWPALMRPAVRRFATIAAQTDADAQRFAILGETEGAIESRIVVVGNVKFDVEIAAPQRMLATTFRARLGTDVRVLLFASTRDGEEDDIVDAWKRHGRRQAADGARIVVAIVPRHPQRFDAVAAAIAARGLVVQRRSDDAALETGTDVWLGDSMGELVAYYLAADAAYVGGSIAPLGGQNLIEAGAAGCPVLIGRHTFNFAAASDEAVRTGAAVRVVDYDTLIVTALALADDAPRRRRMAAAGIAFAAAHRGATRRTVAIVDRLLAAWGPSGAFQVLEAGRERPISGVMRDTPRPTNPGGSMYLALNRAPRAQSRPVVNGASAIDQLFDGFFYPTTSRATAAQSSVAARFDVVERADRFEANLEIPGVAKDDIDVQIDGATVRVKAAPKPDVKADVKADGAGATVAADQPKVLHSTRTVRSWFRSFTLPAEVDESRAEAAYENGVLTLTLPKKEVAQPKKLAIR